MLKWRVFVVCTNEWFLFQDPTMLQGWSSGRVWFKIMEGRSQTLLTSVLLPRWLMGTPLVTFILQSLLCLMTDEYNRWLMITRAYAHLSYTILCYVILHYCEHCHELCNQYHSSVVDHWQLQNLLHHSQRLIPFTRKKRKHIRWELWPGVCSPHRCD